MCVIVSRAMYMHTYIHTYTHSAPEDFENDDDDDEGDATDAPADLWQSIGGLFSSGPNTRTRSKAPQESGSWPWGGASSLASTSA
jgi:hypothetical protein